MLGRQVPKPHQLPLKTDKPTNQQTNKQTNKPTNQQTNRQTDKQTNRQTDKQTSKQRSKQITPEPKQKQQQTKTHHHGCKLMKHFHHSTPFQPTKPRFDDFFTHFHVTPETHRAILPEHGDAAPRFPRIDGGHFEPIRYKWKYGAPINGQKSLGNWDSL